MLPVEIYPIQDAMVLRARGSELLILADHVAALKNLKSAGEFARYFMDEALVNRPARKLFEAWLRKDGSLWARIYKTVQTIESSASKPVPKTVKADDTKTASKPTETVKAKAEAAPAKKEEKKEEKKTTAKKEEPKKASPKAAAKPAKAEEKKAAPKAGAKPAAKTAAKPAAKPAAKTAAKKPTKK